MALDKTLETSLILRSISGGLSIIGSVTILFLIFKDRETRKKDTRNFYKIMGALSFFDIFYSACYPLNWWSALTVPNNGQICTFIGFVFVVSQASTYYNASLSLYYLFVINLNKSQDWISKYAMWPLLIVPVFYGLLSACIALGLNAYGWNGFGCWFMGEHMEVLSNFVAGWTPVIIALFIVVVCMAMIVRSVFLIEKKILSYGHPRNSGDQRNSSSSLVNDIAKMNKTKQLAYEALLFIGAFLSSYIWFPMIAAQLNTQGGTTMAVTMGYSFCAPLQGFWNFLIFYRRYRKMKGGPARSQASGTSGYNSNRSNRSANTKAAHRKDSTGTTKTADHHSTNHEESEAGTGGTDAASPRCSTATTNTNFSTNHEDPEAGMDTGGGEGFDDEPVANELDNV